MPERFNSFPEATARAKSWAKETGKTVKLVREGAFWIVSSNQCDRELSNNAPKHDASKPVFAQNSNEKSARTIYPENNPLLRMLKGYYIGCKLHSSQNKEIALRYISQAIGFLRTHESNREKVLLYYAAETEYYRESDLTVLKRKLFQEQSNRIDEGWSFSTYMKIESATETYVRAHGI